MEQIILMLKGVISEMPEKNQQTYKTALEQYHNELSDCTEEDKFAKITAMLFAAHKTGLID